MDDKQLQSLFQQALSPQPIQESAMRSRLMAAIAEEEARRQQAWFWEAFTNVLVDAGRTIGNVSQVASGWTRNSLQIATT